VKILTLKTRQTTVILPGLEVPLLVVENVESLITDLADEEKVPLWAEIWPAARGISRYIWENMDFSGQRVLELGCGLGLAGVVCGLKGAKVTFSDYQPAALEISQKNARLNGLTGTATHLGDWRSFHLQQEFDWIVGSDILYDHRFNGYLGSIFQAHAGRGKGILVSHPGRQPAFEFIKKWCEDTGTAEEHEVVPIYVADPHFPYYEINVHRLTKKD